MQLMLMLTQTMLLPIRITNFDPELPIDCSAVPMYNHLTTDKNSSAESVANSILMNTN